MKLKKILPLLIVVIMSISLFSGCESYTPEGTLVLGSTEFNGVFSPFFGTTGYDMEISDQVHAKLLKNDRAGSPISNIAEYKTPVENKDADGKIVSTTYTFKLKNGLKFSDGQPVTADDIIFSYQVLCDPNYDGPSTIYTTPILGVNEYRYDDPDYTAKIAELKTQSEAVSDDEVKAVILASCTADYIKYGADDIAEYAGFENTGNLEGDALKDAIIDAYVQVEIADYWEDYKGSAIESKFAELEKEYIKGNLASGELKVPNIEGIKKIDERTVEVVIEGVDPKAIWNLGGIDVAPKHYYGVGKDGTEFSKGKIDIVKEKNSAPVGAGAYTFEKFADNVVTLKANPDYHLGQPRIATLKYQVTSSSSKIEGVKLGNFDISDPSANQTSIDAAVEAGLHYELIDNLGYGYIGINSERITDINIRKGLMYLMDRAPAVKAYYGELASVIERPMSMVSWAYPKNAKEFYGFSPEKALQCFKDAGYEQVDGKLVKNGTQLRVEVGIAGDGIMDHPSAPVLTTMKLEMEKLGGVLDINDCDGSVLFNKLDNGEWDMWVAAWGATIDPDMYQTYHSQGPSNHYKIKNEELDRLIIEARQTNDVKVRQEKYFRCLDIIMENAVEMPIYQRKNMYIFNPNVIDIKTLPKNMTPFYGYFAEIEDLRTVAQTQSEVQSEVE